jgi:mannose-6-phosphate isomerase-like protein (cupin superfamily)
VAPNKPHWKLSEILASHKGQSDWVQPIVRNKDQEGDYISLAPGKKTKQKMYSDDRVVFIVWDGSIRVSIDGYAPFTATKGFMVNVPFRHMYTLENVGSTPALRFEVRQAGAVPLYPVSETPDPVKGMTYVKVTNLTGPAKEKESNPIYVDYMKEFNGTDKPYGGKFVWDDHFTSNILRGKGAPVPPDTNKGHFHVGWTEFWFIMEGKIGMKVEGLPYFNCDPGDVMIAAQGRWHRAGDDPAAPWSTRVPFNPRPPILHNFEVTGD